MIEIKADKDQVWTSLNGPGEIVQMESSGVIAVLLAEVYMGMLRSGVPDEAIKQNMAALIGHSVVSYEDILREKKNSFSMIKADYLMKNRLVDKNVFIFLSKGKDDTYFCRSFFPEANRDYTKNQASWTLLYKEKMKRSTGQKVVLYDRLKRV